MSETAKQQLATLAVHAGQVPDPTTGSRAVPIYQTTSYLFQDADHAARLFALQEFGNIYTRIMNPTTDVFEKRVAALEGGAAGLATASGQAAETLIATTLASAGDEIVSTTSLYGGTYNLFHYTLPKLGITVRFVDADDFDGLRKAINEQDPRHLHRDARQSQARHRGHRKARRHRPREQAAAGDRQHLALRRLWCGLSSGARTSSSTPPPSFSAATAPPSAASLSTRASSTGLRRAASRTSPSPIPLITVSRYTEAFGPLAFILKARVQGLRDTGAALSPFNAFLLLQGIETLHLRMERHSQNALAVAQHLEKHPGVEWVNYPGLKSSPYYERAQKVSAQRDRARSSPSASRAVSTRARSSSTRSSCSRCWPISAMPSRWSSIPASTTHQQLSVEEQAATGVTPELVRLSVGIEDIRDRLPTSNSAIEAANGCTRLGHNRGSCCTIRSDMTEARIGTNACACSSSRQHEGPGSHLRRRLCAQ